MNINDMVEDDERIVARIQLLRVLTPDGGMRDIITTEDGQGEELDLPSSVGMLAIAQHTLLCEVTDENRE